MEHGEELCPNCNSGGYLNPNLKFMLSTCGHK